MKAAPLAVSVVSSLLLISACEPESKPQQRPKPHHAQTGGSPAPATPSPSPAATPDASATPSPTPEVATPTPSPSPTTGGGVTGTIPYGIPVPGKPGFVESPFAPGSGYIDVRGFPPNSEAKDPYSGKIFRVP